VIGIPHPYLTASHPGIGGRFKESLDDFLVEEVPLYHPADRGEHTFFEVEKTDLSTLEALERIARELSVEVGEFGFAGLKDRKGVTRQVFSVRLVPPERVLALKLTQIKIHWARLHVNKLRVGHLRGNRFRIRVRGVEPDAARIDRIIGEIHRLGLPNFYGPQRFGNRGDAFRVGRALLKRNYRYAVRRLLGYPQATERNPHVVEGRRRFMAGDLAGALEEFPRSYRQERRLLGYLIRAEDNYRGAVRQLSEPVKKLYFSAYQSYLFNRILERRLARSDNSPGRLFSGDLAWIHRNGAIFKVIDLEKEQPRADSFEISPSGPIFGIKMPAPEGPEAEIESTLLAEEGIPATTFHRLMPGLHMEGGRRPLRVAVRELKYRLEGVDLLLEFFLSKGSYATTFLREIMKCEELPPGYDGADEEEPALQTAPPPGGEETAPGESEGPLEVDLDADDEPPLAD
jgi:tRNA pseudouridine13 synthase